MKEEYEKTRTHNQILVVEKTFELYEMCFVVSFTLSKENIRIFEVKTKSNVFTYILLAMGIIVLFSILIGLDYIFTLKNTRTRMKF